ncbi:MAG: helix-turn-helix transcriptional regulator [Erysipelotrichaceae bacterium]
MVISDEEKNLLKLVGNNINRIRLEHNLTIGQLSTLTNISESIILAAETGNINLSINQLSSISNSLDIEVKELLTIK